MYWCPLECVFQNLEAAKIWTFWFCLVWWHHCMLQCCTACTAPAKFLKAIFECVCVFYIYICAYKYICLPWKHERLCWGHLDNIFYSNCHYYSVSRLFFHIAHTIQLEKKWKKDWWSHICDANFVRIACGNMDPLLFIREGLELSEMCIKTHDGLFQRSLWTFKK